MINKLDFEPANPTHEAVTETLNRALAALGEIYPRVAALTEVRDAAMKRGWEDWRPADAELQEARDDRYSLEIVVDRLRKQQLQAMETRKQAQAHAEALARHG